MIEHSGEPFSPPKSKRLIIAIDQMYGFEMHGYVIEENTHLDRAMVNYRTEPSEVIARFARIIAQFVELAGTKIIAIHTSVPKEVAERKKRNKLLLTLILLDIDNWPIIIEINCAFPRLQFLLLPISAV